MEEEAKLLPPPGMYAVRIANENNVSIKGIARIDFYKNKRNRQLILFPSENIDKLLRTDVYVKFYKEMHFATNENDFPHLEPLMEKAMQWIY